MRFLVRHTTQYSYSSQVFLEPQTLRLRPRNLGSHRVNGFSIRVQPYPVGLSESLDACNNPVHHAWFEGLTSQFRIETSFEADVCNHNPFNFLLDNLEMATLPVVYPETERIMLAPFCAPVSKDRSIYSFAKAAAQEVEWHTLPFLTALTRKLHDYCDHVIRAEGDAQAAEITLATRSGACRDVAVAFIEACRCFGIAARFVSGYDLAAYGSQAGEMHAWAEIYLPGAGWRGYDPSRGLAVSETHLAVASGLTPALAAPVSGSFRGADVEARLEFEILVTQAVEIAGS